MNTTELQAVLDRAGELINEAAITDIGALGIDEREFACFCGVTLHQLLVDRGVDHQLADKLAPKFMMAIADKRRELALMPTSQRIH